MLKTYRTADGDFRLSESSAMARGLLPSPSGLLPAPVARRLRRNGATTPIIEGIATSYVTLEGDEAKASFLQDLAMTPDRVLKTRMAELVAEHGSGDALVDGDGAAKSGVDGGQPAEPVSYVDVAGVTTTVAEEVVVGDLPPEPTGESAISTDAVVAPLADPVADELEAKRGAITDAVTKGRVGDVTDAVGEDAELARYALEVEREHKNRPTLVATLEGIAAGNADEGGAE